MINFPSNIFEKFSLHLKNSLGVAEKIAKDTKSDRAGILHLMYGAIMEKGSIAANVLEKYGVNKEKVKDFFPLTKETGTKTSASEIEFSEAAKSALQKAVFSANKFKNKYIGTEHLLLGILETNDAEALDLFGKLKLDVQKVKDHIVAIIENTSRFTEIAKNLDFSASLMPNMPNMPKFEKYNEERDIPLEDEKGDKMALDYFCVDLTKEAEDKKFDPVIGRDVEVENLIIILNRKIKNNPLLIGEPGVGKTAIAQGLAQRIVDGDVPKSLEKKRVMSLDLGLLVAGSIYRGEFEGRLKDVIYELSQNKDIILFIDEFHTVIGTGSATGSLDAANILKPALSRGELRCIAATTFAEYQKYIKKDAALERRFQPIIVNEPSVKETIEILKGLKASLEKFHNVEITKEAIEQAVLLSKRFINDRYMPDKALDVLDQAASFVKGKRVIASNFKEIKKLTSEKNKITGEKEEAVRLENYEKAVSLKEAEEKIGEKILKLEEPAKNEAKRTDLKVEKADIEKIISQITRIPVSNLIEKESKKLRNLEASLEKEIVGQTEAIKSVAKVVRRSRAGISDPKRPLGSFLFLGPSGVGKTKLAEELAESVFGGIKNLIKINMSEFMERHNVSRLLGAPAGYVGFEEGGKLAEAVRINPYSVVLFDELEKAHTDVANILLQILENGEIIDAQGRSVSFRNTIIIMTSNIGTKDFTNEAALGFSERKEKTADAIVGEKYGRIKESALKELKEKFPVEFLNRIDDILVFKPLDKESILKITKLEFGKLKKRLLEQKIKIGISASALKHIVDKSFNPLSGARLVRKNIQDMVESVLAEKIIAGEIKTGSSVLINVTKEGKIEIRISG